MSSDGAPVLDEHGKSRCPEKILAENSFACQPQIVEDVCQICIHEQFDQYVCHYLVQEVMKEAGVDVDKLPVQCM